MMPTFKESVDYLLQEGYLKKVKGRYCVTAKFNEAMNGISTGLATLPSGQLAVRESQLGVITDWEQRYIQFIIDAKVPQRGEDSAGNLYDMSRSSKEGIKAFREAIEKKGFNYDLLLRSTMLYYAGPVKYKQSIGTYMSQGTYLSDYYNLIDSMRNGTVEQHIEDTLDDGGTAYELG